MNDLNRHQRLKKFDCVFQLLWEKFITDWNKRKNHFYPIY